MVYNIEYNKTYKRGLEVPELNKEDMPKIKGIRLI